MDFYTNCVMLGSRLGYRGIDSNNNRIKRTLNYEPTLYLLNSDKTNSRFTTIYGEPVVPAKYSSISQARAMLKKHEDLEDFPIYGNTNYNYCYISDLYPNKHVAFDEKLLRIGYIDIETCSKYGYAKPDSPHGEVIAITICIDKKYYVFGMCDYTPHEKDIRYIKCDSEVVLLERFLSFWEKLDLDVISGWNTSFYDMPYLVNRIQNIMGEEHAKRLSPWRSFARRMVKLMNREQETIDLLGISGIDMLDAYKKFAFTNHENFKLDTVAWYELKIKKLEHPYANLNEFYEKDPQKFIEYNVRDVHLVQQIEEKKKLISMIIAQAYASKINLHDPFQPVRIWDVIIYNYLKERNIVVPMKQRHDKSKKYKGAHVKDVLVGLHDWVVSYDLTSLYPHIIAQWNISPEKLVRSEYRSLTVEGLLEKEYDFSDLSDKGITIAANGHAFDVNGEGFLGSILMEMFDTRKQYKDIAEAKRQQIELIDIEIANRKANQH